MRSAGGGLHPNSVLIEWCREDLFVNLRLLRYRNVWAGSVVTFGMGFALYGSGLAAPALPAVHPGRRCLPNGPYDALERLPQLLIFPFAPFLMKKFDLRTLVCFGVIVFGAELLHECQYVTRLLRPRLFPAEYRALVRLTVYDRAALGARDLDVETEGIGRRINYF